MTQAVCKAGAQYYMNKSPHLLTSLENYYLGGTTALDEELRRCVHYFDKWFTSDVPDDPWMLCDTFYRKHPQHDKLNSLPPPIMPEFDLNEKSAISSIIPVKINRDRVLLESTTAHSTFGSSIVTGHFLGKNAGEVVAVSAPYEIASSKEFSLETGTIYLFKLNDLLSYFEANDQQSPHALKIQQVIPKTDTDTRLTSNNVYPFGSCMRHIHLAGEDILVVSHPGSSSIMFYHHGVLILHLGWKNANNYFGATGTKLVGEVMVISDLDGDGIEDLIVGCPKCDDGHTPQRGRVYIFNGVNLTNTIKKLIVQKNGNWDALHAFAEDIVEHVLVPGKTANGYENFGAHLAVSELHDEFLQKKVSFLMVTAPGVPQIFMYDLRSSSTNPAYTFDLSSLGIELLPSMLGSFKDGWIFIGASSEHISNTCRQCGRVYVFQAAFISGALTVELKLILEPASKQPLQPLPSFERFGTFGMFLQHQAYISSSSAGRGRGKIWKVTSEDLTKWARQSKMSLKQKLLGVGRKSNRAKGNIPVIRIQHFLEGTRKHGQFGAALAVSDDIPGNSLQQVLFAAEPFYSSKETQNARSQLMGLVNMYKVRK